MADKSLNQLHKEHLEEKWSDWHMKNWRAWGSWFSWGSPVGLGLFFLALACSIWILFQI